MRHLSEALRLSENFRFVESVLLKIRARVARVVLDGHHRVGYLSLLRNSHCRLTPLGNEQRTKPPPVAFARRSGNDVVDRGNNRIHALHVPWIYLRSRLLLRRFRGPVPLAVLRKREFRR